MAPLSSSLATVLVRRIATSNIAKATSSTTAMPLHDAPRQDLPPPGGFSNVLYKRHIPSRGPPGWLLLLGTTGLISTGLFLHNRGTRIQQEMEREKLQARFHLLPLLLAEQDRDYLRQRADHLALEANIMANVPGWQLGSSVYNGKTFVPDSYSLAEIAKSGSAQQASFNPTGHKQ